ncbi:beta-galactosidase [Cohnella sp. LGH]|uniref:beta-galactosidase n=1 Tax=Cohnella sp. LGH TaxID=1619153 RepID=UPI001ADAD194|nr:beta-galactosidase [Cohnella sp. LGH]QTH41311.1 beta-galactosidase [Cohnella sp. LGH]
MKQVIDVVTQGEKPIIRDHLNMGGSNPKGDSIRANSRYLERDGKPWLPVMGEFHFSRFPNEQWEEELLKMKAGGIQVVATYLFWIYHEEIEGRYNWSGDKDLRRFIELCAKSGLEAVVRLGPWAHGECRNGGFPDWIYGKCALRTNDEDYLRYARRFYSEIAKQIEGLAFQDGGPIVGLQFDNELTDNAEHLRTLKEMALALGMKAPLYTVTGWGGPGGARIPQDEVLPLFGGYPDHPWEKHTNPLPPGPHYFFHSVRNDPSIGSDLFGEKAEEIEDLAEIERYPDGCCELGGGVQMTYHRRPVIEADDVAAMATVKLANGCNLLGYYMYHGGTHSVGELSTMQESNPQGNQLPVRSYDFQAPIGEFGQLRESYRLLKRLHLFLQAFGERLAPMSAAYPEIRPLSLEDTGTVRVAARASGDSGFLFFNNYQRLTKMEDKKDVQVELRLPGGQLTVPEAAGFTLKAGAYFIWPYHLDMEDVRLNYATAQPLCALREDGDSTYVFFGVPGVRPEYVWDSSTVAHIEVIEGSGRVERSGVTVAVRDLEPGTACEFAVRSVSGRTFKVLTLTGEQSLHLWKGKAFGRERLILCEGDVSFEKDGVRIGGTEVNQFAFAIYPPVDRSVAHEGGAVEWRQDGVFQGFRSIVRPREISVVVVPVSDAILNAAFFPYLFEKEGQEGKSPEWEIRVDVAAFEEATDIRLVIAYVGDVAQIYIGGLCVADQFYNGTPWTIGLKRFRQELRREPIILKVSPLWASTDVYMPDRPSEDRMPDLLSVRALAEYTVELS